MLVTLPANFESSVVSQEDEELHRILASKKARIKVIGIGGAGNNTINRIFEIGIIGVETIAINTDAQDLIATVADKKMLIGKELTAGLGAGSDPKVGENAAKETESDIKEALRDSHLLFITCGLGGGTGTGAAPIVAEVAKKMGILTVAIVTMPFTMEGYARFSNALEGLEKLESNVDTLIVIPNDKLLELAPTLPLSTAFKVADEILTNAVKGIAELITKPGLINLDFADVRQVMTGGGIAMIGVGESDTEQRTKKVVETITSKLDDKANVIWGAQLTPDLQSSIKVMLVITGVKSPQIFGKNRTFSDKKREDLQNNLGIEFVD